MPTNLNPCEELAWQSCPVMNRVNDKVKPPLIQVSIPYRHSPDFLLFHWFIEVKGLIRNKMWLAGLEHLPDDVRNRYKVVWATQNKSDRKSYKKALDKRGIEYADDTVPVSWLIRAKAEWDSKTEEEKKEWNNLIKRYIIL